MGFGQVLIRNEIIAVFNCVKYSIALFHQLSYHEVLHSFSVQLRRWFKLNVDQLRYGHLFLLKLAHSALHAKH